MKLLHLVLAAAWLASPHLATAQTAKCPIQLVDVTAASKIAFRHHDGGGHLYQGRFKSLPIQADDHFYTVARYVERNALRAGLAERAEDWRFGSLWALAGVSPRSSPGQRLPLSPWPVARPESWIDWVNAPQTEAEVAAIRKCIQRGRPYGDEAWTDQTARELDLEWTLRPRGRPKKTSGTD